MNASSVNQCENTQFKLKKYALQALGLFFVIQRVPTKNPTHLEKCQGMVINVGMLSKVVSYLTASFQLCSFCRS